MGSRGRGLRCWAVEPSDRSQKTSPAVNRDYAALPGVSRFLLFGRESAPTLALSLVGRERLKTIRFSRTRIQDPRGGRPPKAVEGADRELRKSRDATHFATDGPAPRHYDGDTAAARVRVAVFVRSEKSNALVGDGVPRFRRAPAPLRDARRRSTIKLLNGPGIASPGIARLRNIVHIVCLYNILTDTLPLRARPGPPRPSSASGGPPAAAQECGGVTNPNAEHRDAVGRSEAQLGVCIAHAGLSPGDLSTGACGAVCSGAAAPTCSHFRVTAQLLALAAFGLC